MSSPRPTCLRELQLGQPRRSFSGGGQASITMQQRAKAVAPKPNWNRGSPRAVAHRAQAEAGPR
jgi:hypothetical protein